MAEAEQARLAAEAEHERRAAEAEQARLAADAELDRAAAEDGEPVTEQEAQPALVSESGANSDLPIYRWFDGR